MFKAQQETKGGLESKKNIPEAGTAHPQSGNTANLPSVQHSVLITPD